MKRFLIGLAMFCALPATQADAQNTVQDFYSPTVQWRQASGWEVTPIHVGLLPNGELFFLNNRYHIERVLVGKFLLGDS